MDWATYYKTFRQWDKEKEKAEEINKTIIELSEELNLKETHPAVVASSNKLHTYAFMKGLINAEELRLLREYVEK